MTSRWDPKRNREGERESTPKAPKGGKRTKPAQAGEFDLWWEAYPHKVGKDAARRLFEHLVREGRATVNDLTAGVEAYKRTKPPTREWCNPATWLNQGRWKDCPAEPILFPNGAGSRPPTVRSGFEVRGVPVPEANAVAAVERWRDGGPWHEPFGPSPDSPACRIPPEWLKRAGVRLGEPRPTPEQRH